MRRWRKSNGRLSNRSNWIANPSSSSVCELLFMVKAPRGEPNEEEEEEEVNGCFYCFNSSSSCSLLASVHFPAAPSTRPSVRRLSRWQTFTTRPGVIITWIRIYHLLSINKFYHSPKWQPQSKSAKFNSQSSRKSIKEAKEEVKVWEWNKYISLFSNRNNGDNN